MRKILDFSNYRYGEGLGACGVGVVSDRSAYNYCRQTTAPGSREFYDCLVMVSQPRKVSAGYNTYVPRQIVSSFQSAAYNNGVLGEQGQHCGVNGLGIAFSSGVNAGYNTVVGDFIPGGPGGTDKPCDPPCKRNSEYCENGKCKTLVPVRTGRPIAVAETYVPIVAVLPPTTLNSQRSACFKAGGGAFGSRGGKTTCTFDGTVYCWGGRDGNGNAYWVSC